MAGVKFENVGVCNKWTVDGSQMVYFFNSTFHSIKFNIIDEKWQ